jgi:transcriptional regulator with XRE-family HTH domain
METRIKDISERKKISYSQLAKQMGVSRQSLTNWTTGKRQMKLDDLEKIAKALDSEVVELIPVSPEFAHFYDENGVWQGIRRK